jgi:hypothetical protein
MKHTALPVDVFHHRTKHQASDVVCRTHCDPSKFPELMDEGKWRFNSSMAEETNVWLDGFQSIVREMQSDRFSFFLDEMIKRRNRMVIDSLERSGKNPGTRDRAWLLGGDEDMMDVD